MISIRRTLDVQTRKLHLPVVNRMSFEPPPIVVAAEVGPPKVGKSTLISSLVKKYVMYIEVVECEFHIYTIII